MKFMHTAALANHYENEMAVVQTWIDGVLCQVVREKRLGDGEVCRVVG